MSVYRMFVKDAADLANRPVANFPLLSGTFGEDQQSIYNSKFTAVDIPSNFDIGDFCGVYDEYGRIVWSGIITLIKESNIEARPILSLYDQPIFLYTIPNHQTLSVEGQLAWLINKIMYGNGGISRLIDGATTITTASTTSGGDIYTMPVNIMQINRPTGNLLKILQGMHDAFGIYTYFTLPFGTGNLQLKLSTPSHSKVVVGDNAVVTYNINVGEDEIPDNVLHFSLYNSGDGSSNEGYISLLKDGTYEQNPQDTSLLFHNPKQKLLTMDDNDWEIPPHFEKWLPPMIYNHNIDFDMLLENNLYDFFDWELGMPMDIWKDGKYYSTKFTAWEMSFTDGQPASTVHITCGTARTKLTEVLNATE